MKLRLLIFFLFPCLYYAQSFEWVRQSIPNSVNDIASHIVSDPDGNSYVSGTFQKTITIAQTSHSTSGTIGSFLAKFNSSGELAWIVTGTSSTDVYFSGIAIDELSTTYFVATTTSSVITIGSMTVNAGPFQNFLCRVNKNGSVTMLKNFVNGPLADAAELSYSRGALFMHSTFGVEGTVVIGANSFVPKGNTDFLVAKFDTLGRPLWSHAFGGVNEEKASGIAINSANEVFICGKMNSPVLVMGTETLTAKFRIGTHYIAKFDQNGEILWAQTNTKGIIFNSCVATDREGGVYFGGSFTDTVKINKHMVISKGTDAFVIKLNETGNSVWQSQSNSANVYLSDLVCDWFGNTFFCGFGSTGTIALGTFSVVNSGKMTNNTLLGILNNKGQPLGLLSSGGSGEDVANGISRDLNGNLYVIGNFNLVNSFAPNQPFVTTMGTGTLSGTMGNYFYLAKIEGVKELIAESNADATITTIFPNPAADKLYIVSQGAVIKELILYDISGKYILSKKELNSEVVIISLLDLVEGIYIAEVTTTTGTFKKKVFVR